MEQNRSTVLVLTPSRKESRYPGNTLLLRHKSVANIYLAMWMVLTCCELDSGSITIAH